MSARNQMNLSHGSNSFNILVSDTGTSFNAGSGDLVLNAQSFKFQQSGQAEPTNLFTAISTITSEISSNSGTNTQAFTGLNNRVDAIYKAGENGAAATGRLVTANTNLTDAGDAAQAKLDVNAGLIGAESQARIRAVQDVEQKFSLTYDGAGTPANAGKLFLLDADIATERALILQETKQGQEGEGADVSTQGDRQQAILAAKKKCNDDIVIEQGRITTLKNKMDNFFGSITITEANNLAALINAYTTADNNIANTLATANGALSSLTATVNQVFPENQAGGA